MTNGLISGIALAILMLGSALALRYAENAGAIGADDARRAIQVLIGLMLAGYANLMPKRGRGVGSLLAQARVQTALRIGGWSLTMAGLAYAGLWAFAPLEIADTAGLFAVAAATLLTLGYAVWAFTACRRDRGTSTSR
ncbi:MAG: hypothetical protein Q8R45_02715 [Brevundimonas sp.]|uniref:hypothetical protein n=1 Tax=Brevundimonas sp. TaxID=1871086 RepID=UPI00272293B2|nr:hypothetical protein [Brevundimonas sp.]MDO9587513.1 hypothetical protein [Brevundimonas sp.]MDP3368474.1 hypothetical protein [Brevundimonas sp.]MDP3655865.1 hypothetical protein [Brevundimonas sp.]MDZ4112257.1 hypothetical protein [Brevundimonas sp.]